MVKGVSGQEAKIHLRHLSLTNFRNFLRLEADFLPGLVVLFGGNAQGKSNLLEAVCLLATSRSPRAGSEAQLLAWGWEGAPVVRLWGEFQGQEAPLKVEVAFNPAPAQAHVPAQAVVGEKLIKVNGVARRATDLLGRVGVVFFSAQDIEIVAGAPASRRRFLDQALSLADRSYYWSLQRYQKVLESRNRLLRLLGEGRAREDELAFWDQSQAELGSALTLKRAQFLQELNPRLKELHLALTGGGESLEVGYRPSLGLPLPGEKAALEDRFRQALLRNRERERALGVSLTGPQRDDLQFLAASVDLGVYGSRAQQRSVALALRLAEASYLRQKRGEPLLLLDDVLSELDRERQGLVLQAIAGFEQVFLTTADLGRLEGLPPEAALFELRQGRLVPPGRPEPAVPPRGSGPL